MTKEKLTLFSSTMQRLQFNISPVDDFLKSSNKKFLDEMKPVYLERVKKVMMENVETFASEHVCQSLKDVNDTVDSFRLDVSQQKYCFDNSMMPLLNCIHPSSIEARMLMSQKEQRHNYLLSHPGPNGQILTRTQLQMRQIDERMQALMSDFPRVYIFSSISPSLLLLFLRFVEYVFLYTSSYDDTVLLHLCLRETLDSFIRE
ncbi:MAG: hypothetical protein EZS28_038324 [Streblomastix strix]|uniref:Uncharacterized protein n=1 Tax=Streblomastix strix TaxID=222440 RepID=A0A5J4U743_9EUKA|nr:MAG: hypothetical protein EZS28_038324 [Streblomastix strix]